MSLSEQDNQKPPFFPCNFANDGMVDGGFSQPEVTHEFSFPALNESTRKTGKNPLSRSLKDFLPTVFEQSLPGNLAKDSRNLENTRRRLLDQLEAFKKEQENKLYQLRLEAESQAEELVKQAEQKAAKICREAEEQGFQEGLKRGDEQVAVQVASLAEMLSVFVSLKKDLLGQYETQLLDLAMVIARKIVHQELSQNPEVMATIARETISEMPAKGPITLRVHPDDYQVLNDKLPALQAEFEQLEQVQLVAGEGLARGSCILETPVGQVDAGLNTRFAEISDALRD
ncbi:MAG: FliH/SctL family protein [Pseudomonadota bacterium]|nr:FliH/SctL family protein [Pseudomonadota bacterium]MEA3240916.1 FliH/SctL family protein [Pseudomonadota bacterium]